MKLQNALLVAKLRQEAVEANETLLLHVEETAHQKATNAAEVQNLNHVIRIQEQSPEVQSGHCLSNTRKAGCLRIQIRF